jgi:hypothetical protein
MVKVRTNRPTDQERMCVYVCGTKSRMMPSRKCAECHFFFLRYRLGSVVRRTATLGNKLPVFRGPFLRTVNHCETWIGVRNYHKSSSTLYLKVLKTTSAAARSFALRGFIKAVVTYFDVLFSYLHPTAIATQVLDHHCMASDFTTS